MGNNNNNNYQQRNNQSQVYQVKGTQQVPQQNQFYQMPRGAGGAPMMQMPGLQMPGMTAGMPLPNGQQPQNQNQRPVSMPMPQGQPQNAPQSFVPSNMPNQNAAQSF